MKKDKLEGSRLQNLSAVLIIIAFPLLYKASWDFEAWWKWPGLFLFGIGLFLPVLSPFLCAVSSVQKGGEICQSSSSQLGGIKPKYITEKDEQND